MLSVLFRVLVMRGTVVGRLTPPYCLTQQVLDLAIDATQFVRRPGFQIGQKPGIDAQQEGLSLRHGRYV